MERASGYLTIQLEDGEMIVQTHWEHTDIITLFLVLSKCFQALNIPMSVENLAILKMSDEFFSDNTKDE